MITNFLLAVIIGYLLGCISGGYLMGRVKKVDVRKSVIGNTGATSVGYAIGFRYAVVAGAIDFFKGIAAMLIAVNLGLTQNLAYVAGAACIAGHNHPFYLGFKGGRGGAVFMAMAIFGLIYYRNDMAVLIATVYIITVFMMGPRIRKKVISTVGLRRRRTKE